MEEQTKLKSVFLPYPATSHIIPLVDMARLFALHGVDVTIIATAHTATTFQKSINLDFSRGRSIRTHIIEFPAAKVGLPVGIETFNADTPHELTPKIYMGLAILQPEIDRLFHDLRADFIVTDMFHPWTVEAAAKLGIPRIMFHAGSCIACSAGYSVQQNTPHLNVKSDTEKFTIPDLPHELKMITLQLPTWMRTSNQYTKLMNEIKESEKKSFALLFNSFYELENDYHEHYKRAIGTNCLGLGPISLWVNHDDSDKAARGHEKAEEEEGGWLKWLCSKPEGSVLYVSFGSLNKFPYSQLVEIAQALEDSGHCFIWVVRKNDEGGRGDSFLEEFEKRVKDSNQGFLIWGWAPQLLILENPAIGGLVTHAGWNTVVESVNAGLPMVTWPLFAEHFFNEKLVVDVLGIGVPVGAKEWRNWNEFGDEVVTRDEIGRAIVLLMDDGEKSTEMRNKARALSDAAKRAVQVGGSSHNNIVELIHELKSLKLSKVVFG